MLSERVKETRDKRQPYRPATGSPPTVITSQPYVYPSSRVAPAESLAEEWRRNQTHRNSRCGPGDPLKVARGS